MSKRLRKLENWITEKGYSLKWAKFDQVDYEMKEVKICSVQSKENQIYSFLHECGHIILSNKSNYNKDFKVINDADVDARKMRSDLYKYKQLREEIEAWECGYELANQLKIRINKDKYDAYAAKCFKTYVKLYAS